MNKDIAEELVELDARQKIVHRELTFELKAGSVKAQAAANELDIVHRKVMKLIEPDIEPYR